MSRYQKPKSDRGTSRKSRKKKNKTSNKKMTRRYVSIIGDGNCMFRSVSYCVFGTQDRHREIRKQVVDRVVHNWHRYKDFIIGDKSYRSDIECASDYQRLMSNNGEYAGHVELHCVSEIYSEYTFKVHISRYSRTLDYGTGPKVKHLLFSGFSDAGHYSVLE